MEFYIQEVELESNICTCCNITKAYRSAVRFIHSNEPSHEKINKLSFQPGPPQTDLYNHGSRLEA